MASTETRKVPVGGCGDLLVLRPPKTSLVIQVPLLTEAVTYQPGVALPLPLVSPCPQSTGASFDSQGTPKVVSQQLVSQPGDKRNECWERGIRGGNPRLALQGGVAQRTDAWAA